MTMAEMELRETRPGEFLWQWGASGSRPIADELTPSWPDACRNEGNVLRCGEAGLSGVLSIEGVGERYSAALVKVFWRDGQSRVYTLTERQPSVHLYGSADDKRGMGEIARAYLALGIEHILSGIDHLMFVAALLFLVGFQRKLVWTITAFTLAHSLTLASAALGWLTLRSAPVEATIALSIVLVASEALNPRETLARRCRHWSRSCSGSYMDSDSRARSPTSACRRITWRRRCSRSMSASRSGSCWRWGWCGPCGAWFATGDWRT